MEYVYAALLLHKLGREVDENNVKKIVEAAGANVDESKIKSLITSLKGLDIAKELESSSLAVASAGASSGAKEEKKEDKPKEEKKEAAAEGLSALFG